MLLSLSEAFHEATHGPWTTTEPDIQWRVSSHCLFFKYTNSKSDWKQNLRFWPKKDSVIGWGHSGFLDLWNKVKEPIIEALKDSPPLCISGFSLGAALAIDAHIYFARKYARKPVTFAFGSPKSLFLPNKNLDIFYCDTLYTIYTTNDPVHYLPPSILGYRHVGRHTPLKHGNLFKVGTGFTEERRAQLWDAQGILKGMKAVVKYQHLTSGKQVPRFPVFVEIRP